MYLNIKCASYSKVELPHVASRASVHLQICPPLGLPEVLPSMGASPPTLIFLYSSCSSVANLLLSPLPEGHQETEGTYNGMCVLAPGDLRRWPVACRELEVPLPPFRSRARNYQEKSERFAIRAVRFPLFSP